MWKLLYESQDFACSHMGHKTIVTAIIAIPMELEIVSSLMHYDEKQKEPVVCQECNGKPEIWCKL